MSPERIPPSLRELTPASSPQLPGSSTNLEMLSTIKQQDRVTVSTGMTIPCESAGYSERNHRDWTFHKCGPTREYKQRSRSRKINVLPNNADCQCLNGFVNIGNRLGSVHDEVEEGLNLPRRVSCLVEGHLLTRCLYQRLQLGFNRDDTAKYFTILHMLSTIRQQVRVTPLHFVVETT